MNALRMVLMETCRQIITKDFLILLMKIKIDMDQEVLSLVIHQLKR